MTARQLVRRRKFLTTVKRPPWARTPASSASGEFESETVANVRSYFLNLSSDGLDHWGRYRDQFEKVGDRWLIAHRYARVDGRVEGSWAPAPPNERTGS